MSNWPFMTRKRHEAEIKALRESISKICNTGCGAPRCTGKKPPVDSIEKKSGSRVHHTFVHPGKRVLVTKHNGEQFVARFREKTGKFHVFDDHPRVKSSSVKQLSILTADYKEK